MGALTSKPYAFTARPWELVEREAFDIFDSIGTSVKLSIRGREIMRILPNPRFSNSEEWIADVARFSYDSVSAASRLRSLILYKEGGLATTALSVFNYSSAWFNEFFIARLSSSYTPDHFCLTYFRTVSLFVDMQGRSSSPVATHDFRFFPYHQLSSFQDKLHSIRLSKLILFDFNIRYTLPAAAIKLRQMISQRSNLNVFNIGPTFNNLLGDINLPYNQALLVDVFRFKNRLARVLFSSSSYMFLGFNFYVFFNSFTNFSRTFSNFSVFYSSPSKVTSAELATSISEYRGSSSCFSGANIYGYFASYSVSHATSFSRDSVFIPLPHPYEDDYNYFYAGKAHVFGSPLSAPVGKDDVRFPFYFKAVYPMYTPAHCAPKFNIFYRKCNGKLLYTDASYFAHFFSSSFQTNSINILLNVKRHNEFRSNYIYYL